MSGAQRTGDRPLPPRLRRGFALAATGAVLALLLAVTALAWRSAERAEEAGHEADFQASVHDFEARLATRIQAYELVLRAGAALFAGSAEVTRAEFREFFSTLHLEDRHPGAAALAFAERIPAAELEAHTRRVRAEGFPEYTVHPPGARDPYTSIVLVEPFESRARASFGRDMYADETRRAAMAKSEALQGPTLSAKVTLSSGATGMLMYLPVTEGGSQAAARPGGRRPRAGWVLLALRTDEIISGLLSRRDADLAIRVYDGPASAGAAGALLFDTRPGVGDAERSHHRTVGTVEVLDRRWTLEAHALSAFEARHATGTPLAVAVGGTAVSVLLALLAWMVASSRDRALRLADEMTASLAASRDAERQAREFQSFALAAARLGTWSMDLVRGTAQRSAEHAAIFGHPAGDPGWTFERFLEHVLPEDRERVRTSRQAALASGADWSFECRIRRVDGEVRWIAVTGRHQLDAHGTPVSGSGIIEDVTERKRAEERLRTSEERLAHAIRSTRAGVWDWDVRGNVMHWDDAMLEMYGVARDKLEDGVAIWNEALHPDDRARAVAECDAALKGVREFDTVFRIVRPDGSIRHVKADGLVLRDEAGAPVRMIGLNRDVTEQRRLSEERARLRTQLLHAQKMEAIGALAGGMAHDFNNLLTGVTGGLALLEEELGAAAEPFRADFAELRELVQRGSELSRQLMSVGRRPARAEARPLDVAAVVRTTSAMFGRTHRAITVAEDLAPDLHAVRMDHGELEQVLLNLFLNAAHAMPGGGALHVAAANVALEERETAPHGVAPGGFVRLVVADTGSGMDAATLERIFEPFFTTKAPGEGTGLGLASVYAVVKAAGGFVTVESAVGKGTTFSVFLPGAAAAGRVEGATPVAAPGAGGTAA